MSLLKIQNLSYQAGDKILYDQANFELNPGEHVGITGVNGVGKTTLLKLIQSDLLPDAGDIIWQPSVKVGYLDQHAAIDPTSTVHDTLKQAFSELYDLEDEMMAIYACPQKSITEDGLMRAALIQTTLEKNDFYSILSRIDTIAEGLGLIQLGMNTVLGRLSGGQRHKVILAMLLLMEPDVLLLDEPTNYLDVAHVDWLAEYLNAYKGAFMVISHEQSFLDRIAKVICDIERQKIFKYKGNLQKAMGQKDLDQATHLKHYKNQQKYIKQLEQYIARCGAGVNASIAQGRQKQLDRIERLVLIEEQKDISFSFLSASHKVQQVLEWIDLEVGYTHPILPPMTFTLFRGEKIAITGFNGVGKSTLLNTLVGILKPISGHIKHAHGVKLGYFEQELRWQYPEASPLLLVKTATGVDDKKARQHLARFGISGAMALQAITSLSGGEQTKVKLCCMVLQPSNVLVLDEPTTHLDVSAKDALKKALMDYTGTVILVTHEQDFMGGGWLDRTLSINKVSSTTALKHKNSSSQKNIPISYGVHESIDS